MEDDIAVARRESDAFPNSSGVLQLTPTAMTHTRSSGEPRDLTAKCGVAPSELRADDKLQLHCDYLPCLKVLPMGPGTAGVSTVLASGAFRGASPNVDGQRSMFMVLTL